MKLLSYFLLLACCVLSVGCDRVDKPEGLPKLVRVDITITQDDRPLEGASVLLLAVDPGDKWAPGGTTDAKGIVRPNTQGRYPGVPAGKYKVCVSKTVVETGPPRKETEAATPTKITQLVAGKFGDPQTTPFEIDVESKRLDLAFDVGQAAEETVSNSAGP